MFEARSELSYKSPLWKLWSPDPDMPLVLCHTEEHGDFMGNISPGSAEKVLWRKVCENHREVTSFILLCPKLQNKPEKQFFGELISTILYIIYLVAPNVVSTV